jgi:hypothetical protein
MENEAANRRTDIERCRKLLKCVGDKVAIETLELMIVEKEKRLRAITAPSKGGPRQ